MERFLKPIAELGRAELVPFTNPLPPSPLPPPKGKKRPLELNIIQKGYIPPAQFYSDGEESAVDEGLDESKKYLGALLNETERALVLEKLLERDALGEDYKRSANEVIGFFKLHHPKSGIWEKLTKPSLNRWRHDEEMKLVSPTMTVLKKLGAPFIFPPDHRYKVGILLKEISQDGSPMNTKFARPIIVGYMEANNLSHLYSKTPEPGKISLGPTWILDVFEEHNIVDRKGTTAAQSLPDNWEEKCLEQNYRIAYSVAKHHVPAKLIYAFDQYGLPIILAVNNRTRAERGAKSVPIVGMGDKRQITGTAIVCMEEGGTFIGTQLIWQGTTDRCQPRADLAGPKLFFTHSANHWSTHMTIKEMFEKIIIPDARKKIREDPSLNALQKIIVVMDVWKHHISKEFVDWLQENHPEVLRHYIFPGCTGKKQVGDLVVNKKTKDIAKEEATSLIVAQVAAQLRTRQPGERVKVDIRLSVLKPAVCSGMNKAIAFFESDVGRALLRKGFVQAGLTQVHEPSFQAKAISWVNSKLNGNELAVDFAPADMPPSALTMEEELMDLIEVDDDEN